MLSDPKFHRLMFKINVFLLLTNAFFMFIMENITINFVCAFVSLFGALSSYLTYTRLEENYEKK
jgi:hypothetical protein